MDKFLAIIIASIVLVTAGVLFLGNWYNGLQCKSAYSNYQPEYGFVSGCRIMHDGVLTPVDIIREIN